MKCSRKTCKKECDVRKMVYAAEAKELCCSHECKCTLNASAVASRGNGKGDTSNG